jgi:hypothetical protein
MTGPALLLALAVAAARAPLPFVPVPARTALPSGRVVEAARGRGWLDAGARDGLGVGQVLPLSRDGAPAGACVVEAVADRSASCVGEGIRAGDAFPLPPGWPAQTPPAPIDPPLAPEDAARLRAAIDGAALAKVTAKPLPPRPRARAVEVAAASAAFVGGSVTRHQQRVLASLSRAPVGAGLRLDLDLSAVARTAGADRSAFRAGDAPQLEVREAADSPHDAGGDHT